MNGIFSFTPDSIALNGRSFPAEYTVTPSGAVFVFVRQEDKAEAIRIRFNPDHAQHAAALAAARGERPETVPAPAEAAVPIGTPAAPAAAGAAALLPIRSAQKPCKPPESGERRENYPAPAYDYDYFVYSRPAGATRFLLTNLAAGTVGVNKIFAPRYRRVDLEKIKESWTAPPQKTPARPSSCAGWTAGRWFTTPSPPGRPNSSPP